MRQPHQCVTTSVPSHGPCWQADLATQTWLCRPANGAYVDGHMVALWRGTSGVVLLDVCTCCRG